MAMGQDPNRTPSEHPNPTTQIGSKMGGEFAYQPQPHGFQFPLLGPPEERLE